jgi:hypothetical protein
MFIIRATIFFVIGFNYIPTCEGGDVREALSKHFFD